MQKIYLTGAKGYFGSHIRDFLKNDYEIIPGTVDVRDEGALRSEITSINPDIIINTAGKTGVPNVDWCEDNKGETSSVNIFGALNVALIAKQLRIYCVQIGSGCIYEGDNGGKGFTEEDIPNFYGSFYSKTKIISEKTLKDFPILQLRIRIPIEGTSNPKNVINKLKIYDNIISVNNSFTVIEDFLPAMKTMIEDRKTGIYNMTNKGYCNHEYIMTKYKQIVDPRFEFKVMSLEDLDKVTKAKRSNCILDTTKRESEDYHMPNIVDRIPEIMTNYRNNS